MKSKSPFMTLLTALALSGLAILTACSSGGGGGGGGSASTANQPPIASAGPNQNPLVDTLVTLDGSNSTDADADRLSYQWSFISRPTGSAAALSNPASARPTFTPDRYGRYVIRLDVNDGNGNTSTDSLTVTAGKFVMTVLESDSNGDGITEERTLYTYNADGQRAKEESFDGASGAIKSRVTFTYDTNANPTLFEYDYDANGVTDSRDSYSYDAAGHLTMRASGDGDGPLDTRELRNYDVGGRLSTIEYICGNNCLIGLATPVGTPNIQGPHILVYIHYDANGNESMREYDSDADGVIESIMSWTHDANGRLISSEYDANVGDSIINVRSTNTYNAAGQLTMTENDLLADGVVDGRATSTYNSQGNQTSYEDNWVVNDGVWDIRSTTSYSANGKKETSSEEIDFDGDGVADWHSTVTYDANGNWILYEIDDNADGSVDYRYRYSWERI